MSGELKGQRELHNRLASLTHTERMLAELQTKVVRQAKNNTRPFRKTGNLGRTIVAGYLTKTNATVEARADYAVYVEKGTGIYGPKHRPITPTSAKFLRFPKGSRTTLGGRVRSKYAGAGDNFVYARSVKGRKATPFLEPAARTVAKDMGLDKIVITLWNEGA